MCQDKIAALQATVATLYEELEHRAGIIGELQTENQRLRGRIMDVFEHFRQLTAAA